MAVDLKQLPADQQKFMDGLMKDLARAAELGLIPQEGAKISARGEFIVNPSNIEEDEDKKMRGYRHRDFPKTMHAWGPDPVTGIEGPLSLEVKNRAEEENAVSAGWSVESVHGPAGRLQGGEAVAPAEEVAPVRTFAPPGQFQPHEAAPQTGTSAKTAPAATVKKTAKAKTAKKK